MPQEKPIPGCRSQAFLRDLIRLLTPTESPYEAFFGRLRMVKVIVEHLPRLIRMHLSGGSSQDEICPTCRVFLKEDTFTQVADMCAKYLPLRAREIADAIDLYPQWLFTGCMERIRDHLETDLPISVDLVARPNLRFPRDGSISAESQNSYVFLARTAPDSWKRKLLQTE
jgi:hypothetical protein